MKTIVRSCLIAISFFTFTVTNTAAAQTSATQTTPPVQQPPRDECAGCTPEQRQAAALIKQGRELQNQGKLDAAIDQFKKAMAVAPDYFSVHAALGSVLDVKGDYAGARHHLQKAIDVATTDEQKVSARRSMAVSYAFERDGKDAEKYEREAAQMQITAKKPVDAAGTLNELARIELESGNFDKAYDAYKEGYAIASKSVTEPADKDLWDFRWEHAQARIDARRGLKDEAQKHVAAAKAIFDKKTLPDAQAIYVPYLTGYVAFYLGDYKTALADLQRSDQKDPFILALIAQTYEKMNDKTQAQEYWTKVLGFYSHNPTNAFARPLAKKALGQ